MSGRAARRAIRLALERIERGTLLVEETGEPRRTYGSGPPVATLVVHSGRFWPMLLRGSLGMASAYEQGLWDSPDLVALIGLAARNGKAMDAPRRRMAPLLRTAQLTRALRRPNSRRRRRRDIGAHYDLGNELFRRMLDPTMTYSCAVFEHPRASLEQAQIAKLELVCRKLELTPRDRVLEIGAGWGSFALHAAARHGCHVTTTTISREQHAYVRAQVRAAGLEDRVEVLFTDYRDLHGRYDKLVSLEMIEAVGWRHTGRFLGTCARLLEPHGAMVVQAITIDDRAYDVEKASRSFIKDRIFPGGSLPSMEIITRGLARHTDLQLAHLDDITSHYVTTLRRWRERFEAHSDELASLGYDEAFRRLWMLYLAYCEAGFAERRICDLQLVLAKPDCGLAWLRAPGYTGAAAPAAAARAYRSSASRRAAA